MYAENKKPIKLEELDFGQFRILQEMDAEEGPLIKVLFSINTPYIQRDFNLDLVIWNISEDNMEMAKKVTNYVIKNFNKLFETGWMALYYYLCDVEVYPDVAEHTLKEFFEEQIDFESPYYSIQLEINCKHLEDGIARYCFVVSTTCDCNRWMISDDDMRVYMTGNKASSFDTNNDDCQMLEDLDSGNSFMYGMGKMLEKIYGILDSTGFQYAEPFC